MNISRPSTLLDDQIGAAKSAPRHHDHDRHAGAFGAKTEEADFRAVLDATSGEADQDSTGAPGRASRRRPSARPGPDALPANPAQAPAQVIQGPPAIPRLDGLFQPDRTTPTATAEQASAAIDRAFGDVAGRKNQPAASVLVNSAGPAKAATSDPDAGTPAITTPPASNAAGTDVAPAAPDAPDAPVSMVATAGTAAAAAVDASALAAQTAASTAVAGILAASGQATRGAAALKDGQSPVVSRPAGASGSTKGGAPMLPQPAAQRLPPPTSSALTSSAATTASAATSAAASPAAASPTAASATVAATPAKGAQPPASAVSTTPVGPAKGAGVAGSASRPSAAADARSAVISGSAAGAGDSGSGKGGSSGKGGAARADGAGDADDDTNAVGPTATTTVLSPGVLPGVQNPSQSDRSLTPVNRMSATVTTSDASDDPGATIAAVRSAQNQLVMRSTARGELEHPELGRIAVSAHLANGEVDVRVTAARPEAANFLMPRVEAMAADARAANVPVARVDVDASGGGLSRSPTGSGGSGSSGNERRPPEQSDDGAPVAPTRVRIVL